MATIRSAKKRNRQNEKLRLHNKLFRGAARTSIKNARLAIESGNYEEAQQATNIAVKALDKAAQKSIIHKNNASRRKSRLMKQMAKLDKPKEESKDKTKKKKKKKS